MPSSLVGVRKVTPQDKWASLVDACGGVPGLAEAMGVHPKTALAWVSGRLNPSPETHVRLAQLAWDHQQDWPDAPVVCPTCGHRLEDS